MTARRESIEIVRNGSKAPALDTLERLRGLARSINAAHAAAEASAKQCVSGMDEAIKHALICGQKLIDAKEQAGHGYFMQWREDHCPKIGHATANRYMRLAAKCAHVISLKPGSLRQAYIEAGIMPGITRLAYEHEPDAAKTPRVTISLPNFAEKIRKAKPASEWNADEAQAFRKWFDRQVEPLQAAREVAAEKETSEPTYCI